MKRRTIDIFWGLLIILTLIFNAAEAQQSFKYQAGIGKVDSAGFYKIRLHPGLVALCKNDLSDLRIADQKNNYVPFVIGGELPPGRQTDYIDFPAVLTANPADTGTTLVVENKGYLTIRALWLRLKNTTVSRTVNLAGSDDLKHWFAIREAIPLEQANDDRQDTYLQKCSFPASAYHYFKVQISDWHKNPIDILQAGVYTEHTPTANFIPLQASSLIRTDSGKTTWLTVHFDGSFQVNKLHLAIGGPKYFKRTVYIYSADGRERVLIGEADLSSVMPTDILLTAKTNNISLQILNDDNPPLIINQVIALQAEQYVISYLDTGKIYHFLFGYPAAEMPVYDLKFFTDSLNHHFKQLDQQQIVANKLYHQKLAVKTTDYSSMLWLAIIASLLVLSLLTFKMTTEVKKRAEGH